MTKSVKKIMESLSKEEKDKVMIYLNINTHSRFKKFCSLNKIRMSPLIEKLIDNFLEEADLLNKLASGIKGEDHD